MNRQFATGLRFGHLRSAAPHRSLALGTAIPSASEDGYRRSLSFDAELGQASQGSGRLPKAIRQLISRRRIGGPACAMLLRLLLLARRDLVARRITSSSSLRIGWSRCTLTRAAGGRPPAGLGRFLGRTLADREVLPAEAMLAFLVDMAPPKLYRIELRIGVGPSANLDLVMGILLDFAKRAAAVRKDIEPIVYAHPSDGDLTTIILRFWTDECDYRAVAIAMKRHAHAVLAAQAIRVPYPDRTIHLIRECPVGGASGFSGEEI